MTKDKQLAATLYLHSYYQMQQAVLDMEVACTEGFTERQLKCHELELDWAKKYLVVFKPICDKTLEFLKEQP